MLGVLVWGMVLSTSVGTGVLGTTVGPREGIFVGALVGVKDGLSVGVNVGVFVAGVDFRWLWLCGKTKTHEMRSTKQCRPTHQSWQNLFQYPQA